MQAYPQSYPLLRIESPFILSDADWPAISILQRAYSCGGLRSFSEAWDELHASDPVSAARVLEALSLHGIAPRETDDDDVLELIRKLEVLAGERPATEAMRRSA